MIHTTYRWCECPKCASEYVENTGEVEFGEGKVFVEVECLSCCNKYYEEYTFYNSVMEKED